MTSAGPLLVILTGPSGAGKDSILAALKSLERAYYFAVTATTRPPRSSERDGIDYYFVTPQRFEEMVKNGELLEHAVVYGQHKGVPRAPVRQALAAGKDVLMRTDVQGARYIKSIAPSALTIFVAAPSAEELEQRLRKRGGDSAEQVQRRLRTAREEMAAAAEFDYRIVNDDLPRCVAEVEDIIARERARPDRKPVVV